MELLILSSVEHQPINNADSLKTEILHGKSYLVAPITIMVSGVLNGSRGPLLYPSEDVLKSVADWNYIPLVKGHPTSNGNFISAKDPNILAEVGLGILLNSKGFWDQSTKKAKIKSDGWFDIETCNKVAPGLIDNIKKRKKIEVSTGLFADNEQVENQSFEGVPYTTVTRNYRPDHLAILLDQKGACSVKDGCGIHNKANDQSGSSSRSKAQRGRELTLNYRRVLQLLGILSNPSPDSTTQDKDLINNELSHGDIRSTLSSLLRDRFPAKDQSMPGMYDESIYIYSVFDDYVVYKANGKLYQLGYTIDAQDKVTLSNDTPQEVIEITSYKPVNLSLNQSNPNSNPVLEVGVVTANQEKENTQTEVTQMALDQNQKISIVKNLVTNCSCGGVNAPWKGKDEQSLLKLSDDTLSAYNEMLTVMKGNQINNQSNNNHTQTPTLQPTVLTDNRGNYFILNEGNQLIPLTISGAIPTNNQQSVISGTTPNQVPGFAPSNFPQGGNVPVATPVNQKPLDLDAWVKSMPVEAQPIWNEAMNLSREQKNALINQLTANMEGDAKDQATAIYEAMQIPQLRILASSVPVVNQEPQTPTVNYLGRQLGSLFPPTQTPINEQPLLAPVYNFNRNGQQKSN